MRPGHVSFFAVALLALIAGCGGGGGASAPGLPAATAPAATPGTSIVRFVIAIPLPSSQSRRTPKYVSPATQSMTVNITSGGTSVVQETVGLTINSTGCTSSLASITCTLQLSLAPGNYTASITTYDGTNGTGNALSVAQALPFTVIANQNNLIPLSLSGIPASLSVVSSGTNKVDVLAKDADGNYIFGPGAPTYVAAPAGGGTIVSITQPTANAPNTISFALASPAPSPGTETISVSATFPPGQTNTCTLTGAVCSLPSAITASYAQIGFVANNGNGTVLGYTLPLTSSTQAPSYALAASNAYPVVTDPAGTLFVGGAGTNGPLSTFSAPYTAPAVTNSNGINESYWLALDSNDDVFSANFGNNTVTEYAAPYTGVPAATISPGVSGPVAVALDANNVLYVANATTNLVTAYAPPYTGAPTSVPLTSTPISLAVSGSKLYVGEGTAVDVYALPVNPASTPSATVTSGITQANGLAFDAGGNLFVANAAGGSSSAGSVTEFTAPVTNGASPAVTISMSATGNNSYNPWGLAFGVGGNLYVVNQSGNTSNGGLVEYTPPFSNASTPAQQIVTSVISSPYFIALTQPSLTITP